MLLAISAQIALAQDTGFGGTSHTPFTFVGEALAPDPDGFDANGDGHPSVAYDAATGQYVMVFEAHIADGFFEPALYPDCDQGVWGVGRATSTDGLTWTKDPEPILMPTQGTYASCVIAHPNIMYDPTTGWNIWVKTQQGNAACADTGATDPSWGCNEYTGVGHATSPDGSTWFMDDTVAIPFADFTGAATIGFPSVVEDGSAWHMFLAETGSTTAAIQATSTNGSSWTVNTTPVLSPGTSDWTLDQIYNPSVTCGDPSGINYTMYFGGRGAGDVISGLGKASSMNSTSWSPASDNPYYRWDSGAGDLPFTHWFTLRAGSEYLLWASRKVDPGDGSDPKNHIYFFATGAWDPSTISTRVCASTSTGDTGTTDTGTGTGTTGDTGTGTGTTGDTSTGDTGSGSGSGSGHACGKSGTINLTWSQSWLLVPGIVGLIRRRRTAK